MSKRYHRRDIADHDCGDAICPACEGEGDGDVDGIVCRNCQGSGVVVGLLPNLGPAR